MRKYGYGLLLVLMACGGGEKQEQDGSGIGLEAGNGYKTFQLKTDSLQQTLQVRWVNDTAVTFSLQQRSANGSCTYTLNGEAVNLYFTYDPEQEQDEAGEIFWVDQYLYNRDRCRLALRIAQDTTKVRLQVSSCAAAPDCALQELGVLSRVE